MAGKVWVELPKVRFFSWSVVGGCGFFPSFHHIHRLVNMSSPTTTQAYRLSSFEKNLDGLVLDQNVSLPDASQLGATNVIVEVHAVSLNARDYQSRYSHHPT